jgi:hypothetical protein
MPLWVLVWTGLILIPVNLGGLFFLSEPFAWPILILANIGMVIAGVIGLFEQGASRAMSLPHVIIRTTLVFFLPTLLAGNFGIEGSYRSYVWALLAVNILALGFDCYSAWRWLLGDRDVA